MKYFSIKELCKSASHPTLVQIPEEGSGIWLNIKALVEQLLDPIRAQIGRPIYITSGYRPQRLNAAVGGSKTSNHLRGCAADCNVGNDEDNLKIVEALLDLGIAFDECIIEKAKFNKQGKLVSCGWVHLAYRRGLEQRRKLIYTSDMRTYHPVKYIKKTNYTFNR